MTPEAIEEVVAAAGLVPADADQDDIEQARGWERRIRADQAARIAVEFARSGHADAAIGARQVSTEPTW